MSKKKNKTIYLSELIEISQKNRDISEFNEDPSIQGYLLNRQYGIVKSTVRHKPNDNLNILYNSPISDYLNTIKTEIKRKDLYLTGSWFLGTYFFENDEEKWLNYREKVLRKPRYSDIDLWSENYSENLRSQVKDLTINKKVDLIYGWWGSGINIHTGHVRKCQIK